MPDIGRGGEPISWNLLVSLWYIETFQVDSFNLLSVLQQQKTAMSLPDVVQPQGGHSLYGVAGEKHGRETFDVSEFIIDLL